MGRKENLVLLLAIVLIAVPLYMRVYMRVNLFSFPEKKMAVADSDLQEWELEDIGLEDADSDTGVRSTGIYYKMGEFIVNIAHTEAQRFLKVVIVLELENKGTSGELARNNSSVRDEIVTTLSSKDFPQIESRSGKADLRRELIEAINSKLEKGKVINIFFEQFIAQ